MAIERKRIKGSPQQQVKSNVNDPYKDIKKAIWAYFLLLIFEGALRKWFLPALATPLLIVRDPIAAWVVFQAYQKNLLTGNIYVRAINLIGVVGLITTMIFGHGNVIVALYGARTLFFHFPLMFVMGKVLTREDVLGLLKATLWIAIPMVVLTTLQFYSPQNAWVNRGVGGNEAGAGFSGAQGFFRPPGTFSFTNGNTMFFSLVASIIFYFWLVPENVNKWLLYGATFALLLSIPLSISRSLFFQTMVAVVFTLLAASRKPKFAGKIIGVAVGLVVVLLLLSQTEAFQIATGAFLQRFTVANEAEGGLEGVLIDRYLGGMVGALGRSGSFPLFGSGLGMGTNVGSQLLSGQVTFLLAEGEWGREVAELGPILGIILVIVRISMSLKVAYESYLKLAKGDVLPWLLLSFSLMLIAQGSWGQPTSLGFAVLMGGLSLASVNASAGEKKANYNEKPVRGYQNKYTSMRYKLSKNT